MSNKKREAGITDQIASRKKERIEHGPEEEKKQEKQGWYCKGGRGGAAVQFSFSFPSFLSFFLSLFLSFSLSLFESLIVGWWW